MTSTGVIPIMSDRSLQSEVYLNYNSIARCCAGQSGADRRWPCNPLPAWARHDDHRH